MNNKSSTRLNKYISECGICSRRQADRYIESGHVLINGKKANIGDPVYASDTVVVNGRVLEPRTDETAVYLAFNKPVGVTTTTEPNTRDNIVDYVNYSSRIFPIGRLDKDSQGLIFLTNNGDIVNKILRATNNHQKEYLVTVDKPVTEQFIERMGGGIPILGVTTKRCIVTRESTFVFKIILVQGLNRQIRRMCKYLNYEVTKLERIRIMNVTLKGIPLGEWRELTKEELGGIFKLIENSTSEATDMKSRQGQDKKHDEVWAYKPGKERSARAGSKRKNNSSNRPVAKTAFNKSRRGKS